MKFVPVTDPDLVNKLFRKAKVQNHLIEFWHSPHRAVRVEFDPGEYKTLASARSTYSHTIKRLGLRICARLIKGNLYLIKLDD